MVGILVILCIIFIVLKVKNSKPKTKKVEKGTVKKGTVNINLKSITGYKEQKDEDGNVIKPENVSLKVTVTSGENVETAYENKISPATEKISVPITGKGTVVVKVYIDGVLGGRERSMNLNKETTLTIE